MNKKDTYEHGFKVPENYFDGLEDRLFNKLQEDQLPKEHGLNVPEGYFDTLEDRILSTVSSQSNIKVIPLYKRKGFIYISSVAACLILAFTLFFGGPSNQLELEIADIEAYFEAGGVDYNSEDIAQLLTDEDLEDLPDDPSLFSEESLEEYLLENLDDTSLLIE